MFFCVILKRKKCTVCCIKLKELNFSLLIACLPICLLNSLFVCLFSILNFTSSFFFKGIRTNERCRMLKNKNERSTTAKVNTYKNETNPSRTHVEQETLLSLSLLLSLFLFRCWWCRCGLCCRCGSCACCLLLLFLWLMFLTCSCGCYRCWSCGWCCSSLEVVAVTAVLLVDFVHLQWCLLLLLYLWLMLFIFSGGFYYCCSFDWCPSSPVVVFIAAVLVVDVVHLQLWLLLLLFLWLMLLISRGGCYCCCFFFCFFCGWCCSSLEVVVIAAVFVVDVVHL